MYDVMVLNEKQRYGGKISINKKDFKNRENNKSSSDSFDIFIPYEYFLDKDMVLEDNMRVIRAKRWRYKKKAENYNLNYAIYGLLLQVVYTDKDYTTVLRATPNNQKEARPYISIRRISTK